MTDEEFNTWLASPDSYRTILFELTSNAGGVDVMRRVATRGYVTGPNDSPISTPYPGVVKGGIEFTASLSLDGGSTVSFSDIEIDNTDGEFDSWLDEVWTNKPQRAYIGDVLSEMKIGGTGPNADALIPVCLGENHNITPIVENAAQLIYRFHVAPSERAIEAREGGRPIDANKWSFSSATSSVSLAVKPYGDVTLSVQGDRVGGYRNTVAALVLHVVKTFGTEPALRFTDDDIDQANFAAFETANPAGVGLYADGRMTVRAAVDALAGSLGARATLGFNGKMRLVKIALPPAGVPKTVTETDMVTGSFHIRERLPVRASVKLAYNKNWTVQDNLTGLIPENHKELFKQEWITVSRSDPEVAALYGLWEESEPEYTLLLRKVDAEPEADRRLALRKVKRTVYEFTGFADLMFLELGAPIIIRHWRYGMDGGKLGQIISLSVDWINSRVKVGVLM
jgi:hypothetical protein